MMRSLAWGWHTVRRTDMSGSLTRTPVGTLFVWLLATLAPVAYAAEPAGQKAPPPSGELVYERWCAPCHAPGPGHPGTQSLQLKYAGKTPAVLLERSDLSAQAVAVFVRQGVLLMAPFRKTEISDAELRALAEFVAKNYKP
jgi:(+)-pinoresinol hydroxylase